MLNFVGKRRRFVNGLMQLVRGSVARGEILHHPACVAQLLCKRARHQQFQIGCRNADGSVAAFAPGDIIAVALVSDDTPPLLWFSRAASSGLPRLYPHSSIRLLHLHPAWPTARLHRLRWPSVRRCWLLQEVAEIHVERRGQPVQHINGRVEGPALHAAHIGASGALVSMGSLVLG